MRRAALAFAALLLLPAALAAAPREDSMSYVVLDGGPMRFRTLPGGEMLGINGVMFVPLEGESTVRLRVVDTAGPSVPKGVCHEWTYDDGSHPTKTCWPRTCDAEVEVTLTPRPENATYQRLLVFLFDKPHGCLSRAVAGDVHATFT